MQLPSEVINRSLDSIGADTVIGDFSDGTTASEAARRHYGPTLRQLLRTANWAWARKSAPLLLLADATGQTLDPGTGQPISAAVEMPWTYAYAWPNDGVKARWLTQNSPTINGPAVPIMTGLSAAGAFGSPLPVRFLVSSSEEFPLVAGSVDWDSLPDLSGEGMGLTSRRIVLTNVQKAILVYTKLVTEIELWDELFTEAMVAILGSRFALALIKDKKLALTLRGQQIAIAKDAILHARVANANDAGWPQSINREASWLVARRASSSGGPWLGMGSAPGVYRYGWEAMAFADGSVF